MHQIKRTAIIPGIIILLNLIFSSMIFPSMALAGDSREFNPNHDSGFYYTIQKGDTLWDLSQKFYNSQWDWPGLWEMNKEIKNPHWIYPGKKIQIFLKPEYDKKAVIINPEPEKKNLPPIIPSFTYPEMNQIGFIKETAEPSLGKIIREKDGNLMMSTDDIIYINPTGKASLMPGTIGQIFTTEKIKEKIDNLEFQGIKHLIKAEIKILEHNGDYVTAIITNSYRDANVGDRIMAFYERDTILPVQKNPDPIDAVLICSEDNTVFINDNRIAFINMGKNHNIKPGQIYSVLQENKSVFKEPGSILAKNKENAIQLDPLNSGKLIVLHTEDIASTVMILSSKRDIHPGDYVN
ncbi:MAG: hypothetical protein B6230_00840 [Desulfobacteraceae bacterium 4572_89]|nr:MAG: hypothetical protein B6230_00840 [Desulfobacteraceae bacterium 4572_89]